MVEFMRILNRILKLREPFSKVKKNYRRMNQGSKVLIDFDFDILWFSTNNLFDDCRIGSITDFSSDQFCDGITSRILFDYDKNSFVDVIPKVPLNSRSTVSDNHSFVSFDALNEIDSLDDISFVLINGKRCLDSYFNLDENKILKLRQEIDIIENRVRELIGE